MDSGEWIQSRIPHNMPAADWDYLNDGREDFLRKVQKKNEFHKMITKQVSLRCKTDSIDW